MKEKILRKGQGPRRVIFGPVKSQNMTWWKNATSYYTCNLWLTTVPNVQWKKSHCLFSGIFNAPKSGKNPKNSKNSHFSPIFGDKFVNWNMKSQTRHKDILARQCPFFEFLGFLPLFWTIRNHLKETWRHFPMHV